MKTRLKKLFVLFIDLIVVSFAFSFAMSLRFDFVFNRVLDTLVSNKTNFLIIIMIHGVFYVLFKTPFSMWSKVSVDEAFRVLISNLSATFLILFLRYLKLLPGFPYTVIIIMFFINVLFQFSYRILYRFYRIEVLRVERKKHGKRTLIYGAGDAGKMLLDEIRQNPNLKYNVIGFIDDQEDLHNYTLKTLPIFGGREVIEKIIEEFSIDEVFIAMPSSSISVQNEIAQFLISKQIKTRIVGGVDDMVNDGKIVKHLRPINIEDLLERPEIKIENDEIEEIIKNKVVAVTGAAGSIGSELVRQIAKFNPKNILLIDDGETALYNIQQELINHNTHTNIYHINFKPIILSIRDKQSLDDVFKHFKPEIVFHAAAYKHVPLMEHAPKEAIMNNIFGTHNVIDVSNKYKVKTLVNISTDKAVNPTNVMGATKRFNEMMLQAYNKVHYTNYVAVRFGNVLGSNGSVVPLFKKQIEEGGPVTVTHPDIIRYFMTIPEAVRLVLQAAAYAKGGEIFVLDMGEPVKILTLAEKIIELSGYVPYEEIEIDFTLLRPGEKLFEELLMDESLETTPNPLIMVEPPQEYSVKEIEGSLKKLSTIRHKDKYEIKAILKDVVNTYIDANVEEINEELSKDTR